MVGNTKKSTWEVNKTYKLILIGGDGGENGLREYEGLVWLTLKILNGVLGARVRSFNQMYTRLILVH